MRTFAMVGFSVLGMFAGLSTPAEAQRAGWPRVASYPTAGASSRDRSMGELDPLRPYDAPPARPDAAYRPYLRTPVNPPREEPILRAAAPRHNYFPGLRSGQGPNRNVVDPRTLCVPGRRAMLQR
jgi:hypothetical protein